VNELSSANGRLHTGTSGTDITQRLERIEQRLNHLIEQVSTLVVKVGHLHDAAPLETLQKPGEASGRPAE